jgi:hypothetical protein
VSLLALEFIQPQDGHDKRDCEQAVVGRWLTQQAWHLPLERTTFLVDDLHCKQHQSSADELHGAGCGPLWASTLEDRE